jgi:aryl-alcohol dehydrogenase-like predicted oxidoreductase
MRPTVLPNRRPSGNPLAVAEYAFPRRQFNRNAEIQMKFRPFGKSGESVSEIGIGTWQIGGAEWGDVSDEQALDTLAAAADAGVTFIDTADIYGSGRSEKLIGTFLKSRPSKRFFIATKLGRRSDPGWPANFTADTVRKHTEDSLARLGLPRVDLTQTHCVPMEVMKDAGFWAGLRKLKDQGLIGHFGASVESIEEAQVCIEQGVESLQVIFNVFRRKPAEILFDKASRQGVAIIVRLPLASGLLSGKITKQSTFAPTDHRAFNRDGKSFNVGETFAGLGLDKGVELSDALKPMLPGEGGTMAQWAMRWCLDFPAVTTVIPGAKRPAQARENAGASDLPGLSAETHRRLKQFHDEKVLPFIRGPY